MRKSDALLDMPEPVRPNAAFISVGRGLFPLFVAAGFSEQQRAFSLQQRHVLVDDRPDESVIDGRILMGELVSEIDDPSSVRDRLESLRRRARECRDGLADDDKLSLHRRANEPEAA